VNTDTAWLVLGGPHHLNGAAAPTPTDPLVLIPLNTPLHEHFPSNTVVLRFAELGHLDLHTRDGKRADMDGKALFDGMLAGPQLAALHTGTIVPLFYLSVRADNGHTLLHVHSQIRFCIEDACFIRTTPEPIEITNITDLTWLPSALSRHAENFLFLNNHQRYYRKCFPGKELEYKYTLSPPVDIWSTTVRLYQRLRQGALPGFLMEYRDEFQAWDYINHLYQVTAPEAGRGYVSFIPTTDGKNLVKRKWFTHDTFNRRETHTYGVQPPNGFDDYLRTELGVSATRLPPFRRVRYDVNFESTRTGHVYGIFFDHVSLLDRPDIMLSQCELEYLRSRTVIEPEEQDVLDEIADTALWLEAFLREQGMTDQRGYYSKMTFLLDTVAAHPELAVEVG
jgi:hypothetical protein